MSLLLGERGPWHGELSAFSSELVNPRESSSATSSTPSGGFGARAAGSPEDVEQLELVPKPHDDRG